jgi:hypothetical protein
MWNMLGAEDASAYKTSVDLTYTSGSASIAITSTVAPQAIYQLEDISTVTSPLPYDWMDSLDLNKFPLRRGWTLMGDNIAIRPIPSADLPIRVWYLLPPIRTGDSNSTSTDQIPMIINHEELIILGAAIRLQETDTEVPQDRRTRYDSLTEDFLKSASRYRGPTYVRQTRIFR